MADKMVDAVTQATADMIIGGVTMLVGILGAVAAGAKLSRGQIKETIEIQHQLWEETRAALEDCREERARLSGT
jgi:phosphoribosylformylglycinamidine (FGAM) synthase-like enzyme